MDVVVIFKNKERELQIDYLEFGEGENRVVLTWSSSDRVPGEFRGDGVLIGENDEDAKGRLYEIMHKQLTAIQTYDPEKDSESDWAEIESIEFLDGGDRYIVPDNLLSRFQMHEINEKNLHMSLTVEDYEKLADHVRKTDKLDSIRNCMELHLTEIGYDNIYDFLDKKLQSSPDEMAGMYSDPSSGYDEVDMLNHIITHYGGMGRYRLISNQGTENETENTVLLMKEEADNLIDNIRVRDNGADAGITLTDEDSGEVDIIYVDEVVFIEDEELV